MNDQKVKRRINKFSFDKDAMINGANVHVALVDKAANLTEVLVMKSAPISTSTEVTKTEELIMTEKTIETKEDAVVDTTKAELDALKAQLAEMEVMKSQLAELDDLRKAAQELRDVKKAQKEKELNELTEVVKGYNLFNDEGDEIVQVAKFFQENAGHEATLILKALEKARDSVKAFGEAEHGTELKPQEDLHKSNTEMLSVSVAEILKNRKGVK